jgi:hypothetical protein
VLLAINTRAFWCLRRTCILINFLRQHDRSIIRYRNCRIRWVSAIKTAHEMAIWSSISTIRFLIFSVTRDCTPLPSQILFSGEWRLNWAYPHLLLRSMDLLSFQNGTVSCVSGCTRRPTEILHFVNWASRIESIYHSLSHFAYTLRCHGCLLILYIAHATLITFGWFDCFRHSGMRLCTTFSFSRKHRWLSQGMLPTSPRAFECITSRAMDRLRGIAFDTW